MTLKQIKEAQTGLFAHNKTLVHFNTNEKQLSRVFLPSTFESTNKILNATNPVYTKKIRLKGMGLKVSVEGNNLILKLGYSKNSVVSIPSFISKVKIGKTSFTLESSDNCLLGSFAKELCEIRPTSVYKLKGLILRGKVYRRKNPKKR